MRDTSRDTERVSAIWWWIHNNIPGEPSTGDDVQDVVIRLLSRTASPEARAAFDRIVDFVTESTLFTNRFAADLAIVRTALRLDESEPK
jgi:hypothetical protein